MLWACAQTQWFLRNLLPSNAYTQETSKLDAFNAHS